MVQSMFHPISMFVGLRYLKGRSGDRFSRFVSYMSTAGITIGVLSLITVLSVMNGFEAQLKRPNPWRSSSGCGLRARRHDLAF